MATAATAPVIPAVYFSSAASVFGIGPASSGSKTLITGASGGGLGVVTAPSASKSVLVSNADNTALEFTADPTIGGILTVDGASTLTGLVTAAAGVTLSGGNLSTGASGTLAVGGSSTFTGAVTANAGISLATAGNLALGDGRNLTLTTGNINITGNGAITVSSGNVTLTSGTLAAAAITLGGADVATEAFVQSYVSRLTPKSPVRLRTAAPLPAFTAAGSGAGKTLTADAAVRLTIDGIQVSTGDRILVDQNGIAGVASTHVGIYTVQEQGSNLLNWQLIRATDADASDNFIAGTYVFVLDGTASDNKGYILKTSGAITVDTTELEFEQFSSIAATTAAGSSSQVQYNGGSNAFAASSLFTFSASGEGMLSVNNIQALTGQLGLFAASGQEIMVGTASGQGTTGDSVAFGLSSSVTAPRAIALGRDAIARVADTIVTRAIPIVSKTAAAGSGGLCPTFAASPVVFTTRGFLANDTGDLADAFAIPSGSRFFPQSGFLWSSVYTDTAGPITVKLFTAASAGGTEIASFAFTPSGVAQGVTFATFAATKGYSGTLYPRITSSGSSADVTLRLSIQGVLVEKEDSDT